MAKSVGDNLLARMPDGDLLDAGKIFDPVNWPEERKLIDMYGTAAGSSSKKWLDQLVQHFAYCKNDKDGTIVLAPLKYDALLKEWPGFRSFFWVNCRDLDYDQAIRKAFSNKTALKDWPNVMGLYSILATCFVTSCEAERIFSTQNRIKTKLRNRLKIKHLDSLVRISHSGQPITDLWVDRTFALFNGDVENTDDDVVVLGAKPNTGVTTKTPYSSKRRRFTKGHDLVKRQKK